jgi:predicted acylesterase/phospholipase RssA
MRRLTLGLSALVLLLVMGCRHAAPVAAPDVGEVNPPNVEPVSEPVSTPVALEAPVPTRTCLVLSVGGQKGMAHLGAIAAVSAAGLKIDCVYGNSMGAVIGSLYASAPGQDPVARYRELIARYVKETASIKTGSAAFERLLTGVRRAIAGEGGWRQILSAVSSALSEAMFSERFDNGRFQRVLDQLLAHASIEALPVAFGTSYQWVKGNGLEFGVITQGNVAEAVSRSANNPFIFKNTSLQYLDPGSDRLAGGRPDRRRL